MSKTMTKHKLNTIGIIISFTIGIGINILLLIGIYEEKVYKLTKEKIIQDVIQKHNEKVNDSLMSILNSGTILWYYEGKVTNKNPSIKKK